METIEVRHQKGAKMSKNDAVFYERAPNLKGYNSPFNYHYYYVQTDMKKIATSSRFIALKIFLKLFDHDKKCNSYFVMGESKGFP